MPIKVISSATGSAWIPEIWGREILRNLSNYMVLSKLVNRNYSSELAQMGNTVNIPKPVTLVAQDKPISNTSDSDLTLTTVPITLNKFKDAGPVFVSDLARYQAAPDILGQLTRAAAIALAEAIENDLWALYASITPAVGTAGTDLAPASLSAARKKLADAKVPASEDKYAVISTKDYEALLNDTKISAAFNYGGAEAIRDGRVNRVYGLSVFESQLAPLVTSTDPDTTYGLAFARDAFALVTRTLPLPEAGTGVLSAVVTDDETGLAFRMTLSYDQVKGGYLFSVDTLYGVGVLRGEFAVKLLS